MGRSFTTDDTEEHTSLLCAAVVKGHIISTMHNGPSYRFAYPIDVRYGDTDALGHVNHAKYLTYMETARFRYMERLGLFSPERPWQEVGVIIADVQCAYRIPLHFPETVQVYVRTEAVGRKSFTFTYRLERGDGALAAEGRSVQVAYDYRAAQSIAVPDEWRARLEAFEEGREWQP